MTLEVVCGLNQNETSTLYELWKWKTKQRISSDQAEIVRKLIREKSL